ncbi:N-acetylmuramoyl-L-alanine amidase [Romboutsia hominis]|uniref:N-acetylmuramoyl-L-alanine amidase n=1 Tax=Romboutsia hominis TaxID=1507512 RepID=A0A2P2BSJ3_9FIRM|nr:N-acetylmuramoyl-L-alanine amidase [Romboutsia hominis]CEI73351.1 N-acetylmuramoyl-L-alanine amidase [Romboutsia hominis]
MKKVIIIFFIMLSTLTLYGCNKGNKEVKIDDIEVSKKISHEENSVENKDEDELKKEELEVKKEIKTIVIDPGHSSEGNKEKEPIAPNSSKTKAKDVLGATGVVTKVPEYITTVSIAKLLEKKLTDMGFNVILTKNKVEESLSNIDRAKIGNENNADLVVRIHADGAENQSAKGASVLVPPKNEYTSDISDISKEYGQQIIDVYTSELGIKNRGIIYRDDMTGFNWSEVPVVILEMGFLSNKEEDIFLSDVKNHEKITDAIAKGVLSCFSHI